MKINIEHDFIVTAAALVAVTSCAVKELPPPDGWITERTPVQAANPELPGLEERNPEVGTLATKLVVDRQKLLDSHNSVRQRLGIPALRWSTSLESNAAEWANFLTTEADCQPRRRGIIGSSQNQKRIGENLLRLEPVRISDGSTGAEVVDENKIVLDWFQQGTEFNYDENKCGSGKSCDNYTQVVWRDSQVMGCAAASCADKSQIWVCNYDPPGNFVGQKPY